MALDNEYIEKGKNATQHNEKSTNSTPKSNETTRARKKKAPKKMSGSPVQSLKDRFNQKKVKTSIGVGLLIFSFFVFSVASAATF